MCLCVRARYHPLTNARRGRREVWDQCLYSARNVKSIDDQQWPEGESEGGEEKVEGDR